MNERPDEILLRPYVEYVWAKKFRLILWSLMCAAIALAVAYFQKPLYRAHATVVIPAAGQTSGLGAIASGVSSPLTILNGIVRSEGIRQAVSQDTKIKQGELRTMIDTAEDPQFSQLQIIVIDGKKARAKLVLDSLMRHLTRITADLTLTINQATAKELANALAAKEVEIAKAQDELNQLQARFKTVPSADKPLYINNLQAEVKQLEFELEVAKRRLDTAREAARKLGNSDYTLPTGDPIRDKYRNQIVELEYQLQIALTRFGPDAPEVQRARREVEVAKRQFRDEMALYINSIDLDVNKEIIQQEAGVAVLEWQLEARRDQLAAAPEEAKSFSRKQRELEALIAAAGKIREEYAAVRLKGDVYPFAWTVLEQPSVQDGPVNKKYLTVGLLGFVIGLMGTVMIYCFQVANRPGRQW